jgi:hypothetical protein
VSLSACQGPDNAATLTYDQAVNFISYANDDEGSDHIGPGPGKSFVLYRIVSVDNTGSKAEAFTIDSLNAKAASSAGISTEHIGGEAQILQDELASKIKVAPGAKLTATPSHPIGCILMTVKDTTPPTFVHGKQTNLFWASGNSNVKLDTVRANTTIGVVIGTASPTLLRHRCEGKFN